MHGTFVALLLLLLFRIRKSVGIGPLYACLGLFQFLQTFLANTVSVEVSPGFIVNPGSSVVFTATLLAILLIYIKEDTTETRNIIFTLVITNIIIAILLHTFSWSLDGATSLLSSYAWVMLLGTATLLIDSFLIILVYEFISKYLRHLYTRICLTMLLVVGFDTLIYSLGAFWKAENLNEILLSGMLSKGVFAVFYSALLYLYFKYIERDNDDTPLVITKDVFLALSYRQKFEAAKKDNLIATEEVHLKEIQYQTLTNISPVGIFRARADGYTTYVNPKWCEISGIKAEDAEGYGWLNAVHPDDRKNILNGWNEAVSKTRESDSSYRFVHKDGSVRWVLGFAVPEFNSQNEIIGYVGTITDITPIKQIEQEQVRLRKKAEESDRLKSAFLTNMSHEIRTPMNGILGFTGLLLEPDLSSEDKANYIEIVEKSGQRMLSTVNDIIEISRIESGTVNLNMSTCHIINTVNELVRFFKPEANGKKLTLSQEIDLPDAFTTIVTDQNKLDSILTNLIKNAIKYTDTGTIHIHCTAQGNQLEFCVSDTGIGVPESRLSAIFERFIQADIEDTRAFQGSGLGLAICKAYVEMLGGEIWVESEVGKGSAFYFTVPVHPNQP
jgi:PAS domain S-box-containing protein